MIVYEATKQEFLEDVFHDELVNNICSNYTSKIGKINEREVRSRADLMHYVCIISKLNKIYSHSRVAKKTRATY
jgi:uncharacterized protein